MRIRGCLARNYLIEPRASRWNNGLACSKEWNPLQGLQELSHVTETSVENPESHLEVKKGGTAVKIFLEHTRVVSKLIREAQENKGDLIVNQLNLANAYISMAKHHVPSDRSHPGLLQPIQNESLSRSSNIRMAQAGG